MVKRSQGKGERIVLVLQGGGALGAYQAGAYEALAEAGHMPDWVAGISIGAINAAIIAGNTEENRVSPPARILGARVVGRAGQPGHGRHAVARAVQLPERRLHLDRRRAGLLRAALPAADRSCRPARRRRSASMTPRL